MRDALISVAVGAFIVVWSSLAWLACKLTPGGCDDWG